MAYFKNTILPIISAALWISVSEFLRNELFLKSYWTEHYEGLGLIFPSGPLNGAVWGLWSLLFAIAIFVIAKRFSFLQTALLSWYVAFVLMWVVIWNLNVMPQGLLFFAVPLSLFEAFVATWIIKKLAAGKGTLVKK
jgi:hypothetical protein